MKRTQYPGLSVKEPVKDQMLIDIFDKFVKMFNINEDLKRWVEFIKETERIKRLKAN